MNSSRHERILLVIAAYVIGFTTAFIAFALSQDAEMYQAQPLELNASVDVGDEAQPIIQTSVYVDETGLYVLLPQSTQLLSVNQASPLMAGVAFSATTSGVHYALTDAELSRNRNFVYFCEQLSSTVPTCDPYIFDVQSKILHPVTVNGADYTSNVTNHTSAWSSNDELMLDAYISISPETPWKLTTQ